MSICELRDWNDRTIRAVQSRGGVWAFVDYADGLVRPRDCNWPPPELVQKLFRSDKHQYFYPEDQPSLQQTIGYYTDLQSAHSEDAMVWSYFGPIAYGTQESREEWVHWLLARMNCDSFAHNCCVSLWRRVPHPDNYTPGGPEIDVLIHADHVTVFVEAKWRSGESRWQGLDGRAGQIELRSRFLQSVGARIYNGRKLILASLTLDDPGALLLRADGVQSTAMLWKELVQSPAHPLGDEIKRYYDWKRDLIPRRRGFDAPG